MIRFATDRKVGPGLQDNKVGNPFLSTHPNSISRPSIGRKWNVTGKFIFWIQCTTRECTVQQQKNQILPTASQNFRTSKLIHTVSKKMHFSAVESSWKWGQSSTIIFPSLVLETTQKAKCHGNGFPTTTVFCSSWGPGVECLTVYKSRRCSIEAALLWY